MSTALTTIEGTGQVATIDEEWSVARMVEQATKIQQCMSAVMKKDEHYGVIPGTDKPTLLKPGAEKLCLMFRMCPEYETMRAVQTSELVSYTVRCSLIHIPTGSKIATGLGSCNSREKKYVRPADKKCPGCGKSALIVGKPEYEKDPAFKGGWVCYQKKGGCGAKYKPGDAAITGQDNGVADPSDLDNVLLKMACKRALVAAVLNGTAASDCFTQDLEDLREAAAEYNFGANAGDAVRAKKEQRPQDPRAVENLGPTDLHADRKEAAPAAPKAPAPITRPAPNSSNGTTPIDVVASPPVLAATSTTPTPTAGATSATDLGEAATDEQKERLRGHAKRLGWKQHFAKMWLAGLFGFKDVDALTKDQCTNAILLAEAFGTDKYQPLVADMRNDGLVRPEQAA